MKDSSCLDWTKSMSALAAASLWRRLWRRYSRHWRRVCATGSGDCAKPRLCQWYKLAAKSASGSGEFVDETWEESMPCD